MTGSLPTPEATASAATSSGNGEANSTDMIIAVPNSDTARIHFINTTVIKDARNLAQRAKVKVPDPNDTIQKPTNRYLYDRLKQYLAWFTNTLEMNPAIAKKSQIKLTMQVLTNKEKYHFPVDLVESATLLLEKWENENWGDNDEVKEDPEENSSEEEHGQGASPPPSKRLKSSVQQDVAEASFRAPPRDHPIWGVNGIMHGAIRKSGRHGATFLLDPRYKKRNPKVFGHNGLQPGDWWPFQIIALFNGAHGARVAGIAGTVSDGAWSVVVSGQYEDLDRDEGDVVYYSGSGSHDNKDPKNPPKSTSGTQALHASLATARPVRLLRSAKGKARYSPISGLRYDGLYCVVEYQTPTNMHGGQYERFKLRRLPGQLSLEEIRISSPSRSQLRDSNRIADGY